MSVTTTDSGHSTAPGAEAIPTKFFLAAWLGTSLLLTGQTWLWAWLQGVEKAWWECVLVTFPDMAIWAGLIPVVGRLGRRAPVRDAGPRMLVIHLLAALGVALTAVALHLVVAVGVGWVSFGAELGALIRIRVPLYLPTGMLVYGAVVLGVGLFEPGTAPVTGEAERSGERGEMRRDGESEDGRDEANGAVTAAAPESVAGRIAVPIEDGTLLLELDEIDWIEADRNYVIVHAGEREERVRESLKELEVRLPERFIRIHRSRIVNLDRVVTVQRWRHGDFVVRLRDGTRLRLSRTYRDAVEERIGTRI